MRKVLSASLAGTALLALSSSLASGSDIHPSDASWRCGYTTCGRDRHVVVGSSAGRRDRGCGLVFYPQADDPLGKANRS